MLTLRAGQHLMVKAPPGTVTVKLRKSREIKPDNVLLEIDDGDEVTFKRAAGDDDWLFVERLNDNFQPVEGWLMRTELVEAITIPPPPLANRAFIDRVSYHARTAGSNGFWLISVALAETGIKGETDPATGRVGPFNFTPEAWRTLLETNPDNLFDEDQIEVWSRQIMMAARAFTHHSAKLEEHLGVPANASQLYLAHLVGLDAAKAMLKASSASLAVDQALEQGGLDRPEIDRILGSTVGAKDTSGNPAVLKDFLASLKTRLQKGLDGAHELLGIQDTAGELGTLSRRYESGGDPAAIGFDTVGGWSYGLYQLASKKGVVGKFMDFLAGPYPDFFQVLTGAGGQDAARQGSDGFKKKWKELANNPVFAPAQHHYIQSKYYDPCEKKLREGSILDVTRRAKVLKNVIWSVSVQHGVGRKATRSRRGSGAVGLFEKALSPKGDPRWNDDKNVIDAVYGERKDVNTHFRRSTAEVKASVLRRFENEHRDAVGMLQAEPNRVIVTPIGVGDFRQRTIDIAHSEMETFARKNGQRVTEGQQPLHDRALTYFSKVGQSHRTTPVGASNAWSAAFISFVMREAGATRDQFPFFAAHWKYILQGLRNRLDGMQNASIVYFDRDEMAPSPGDLIGHSSEAPDRAALERRLPARRFSSHTDLVVSVGSGRIKAIGGNVSDTIGVTTVQADAGKIAGGQKHFFLLRINI